MEDVDGILILSLKQAGCFIDDSVRSVAQFDTNLLFQTCVACVRTIDQAAGGTATNDLPDDLPREMSARYRTCSNLANIITSLGFTGELGYNQFMYPNVKDTRKLLTWIVEALPKLKDGENEDEQVGTGKDLIESRINAQLSALLNQTWTVQSHLNKVPKKRLAVSSLTTIYRPLSKNEEKYAKIYLPLLISQIAEKDDIPPSVFEDNALSLALAHAKEDEWNTKGLDSGLSKEEYARRKREELKNRVSQALASGARMTNAADTYSIDRMNSLLTKLSKQVDEQKSTKSRFQLETDFAQEKEDTAQAATTVGTKEMTEEDRAAEEERRKKEIDDLQKSLNNINTQIDALQREIETLNVSLKQIESNIQSEEERRTTLEEEYQLKKKTLDLLENKEKNIKELRQISAASAQRLLELATEWEQHRQPLIDKYRTLKEQIAKSKVDYRVKLEEMKQLREKMKKMIAEIKEKDAALQKLKDEEEKLPKDKDRAYYVDRIMDIIKNVKKQQKEINKIIADNKDLQQEIGTVSAGLSRSFIVTEELIFQDASKDETSKKIYKAVVQLREVILSLSFFQKTSTLSDSLTAFLLLFLLLFFAVPHPHHSRAIGV
eukprot:GEZU01021782.1.p1 GENE.GEZU01021782.1~~GEZU01021782.1.p1  ORF type:complete len:618 (-),score=191.63 GEZU01021782.1:14-1831(-)